jgi:hypothetical protein
VRTILAMEDDDHTAFSGFVEEIGFQRVPGVDINRSSDVTSFILVWESAINDQMLVV